MIKDDQHACLSESGSSIGGVFHEELNVEPYAKDKWSSCDDHEDTVDLISRIHIIQNQDKLISL